MDQDTKVMEIIGERANLIFDRFTSLETLKFNNMEKLELAQELEDEFQISITDDDVKQNWQLVIDVIKTVRRLKYDTDKLSNNERCNETISEDTKSESH